MSGFEALGRDVSAAVDSEGEQTVAQAVKALWVWAGFDAGTNPNHLWEVEYEKSEDGFTVAARVKDKDVWAPEPAPAPPTSAAEFERSGVEEVSAPADEAATDGSVVGDAGAQTVEQYVADQEAAPDVEPAVADEGDKAPDAASSQ